MEHEIFTLAAHTHKQNAHINTNTHLVELNQSVLQVWKLQCHSVTANFEWTSGKTEWGQVIKALFQGHGLFNKGTAS